MQYHRWQEIRVRRFDAETDDEYTKRRDEIVFIVEGFRHGRFTSEVADEMDRRLSELSSGMAEFSRRRAKGDADDLRQAWQDIRPPQRSRAEILASQPAQYQQD